MNGNKRTLWTAILLAATLVIWISGCTANKKPSNIEAALANMAKDVVIPMEAKNKKNPLNVNEQTVNEGQVIYMQACALCHGTDGHSRTNLGRGMYPPAMDLTSPHVQHWSDAELFWIIQNGVRLTGMPSWKSTLSETNAWKLAHFIHALPKLDVSPTAQAATGRSPQELIGYGETLYRQESCFMCHQLKGEGVKVGPDLTMEGTRGRTDDWLIGHVKDPPAYTPGSLMPPFKNLTGD